MPAPERIRDLVDVLAHPTVIRLEHLRGGDAGWITASYYTTPEVEGHLSGLRHALAAESGCGVFLIGQYGSGKSHFLAYVTQNLEAGRLLPGGPEVAALSLLNFRGATRLEDVVGDVLGIAAGAERDRRAGWERMQQGHPRGLLLVIDELSEFLRSKPDRRAFSEDVRFLQYMGEWCQGARFWVLCGMQEQIEHAGDLEHGLYRKIKDRFPLRFLLTPAHVRELVQHAVLVRREGCAEAARRCAAEAREALPFLEIDAQGIADFYPIHPATLDLLEEVRDCFSQSRGVVDFCVTRLRGDAARGVPPFLDRPWGDLLTPECIVDHFRDLLEVQAEFLPLAQRVLPWYEKNLAGLFERDALADLARRLLHLLVLVHLAPGRERLTAQEAASWLLYRASRIDPEKNLSVIARVLDTLAARGRYVVQDGGGYRIDAAEDDAEEFERRLKREADECETMGEGVFDALAPLLAGRAFDPFSLPRDEVQNRSLRWFFHERRYAVFSGNGLIPSANVPLLVLRLCWGDALPGPGALNVLPARLAPERRHYELAALRRLAEGRWSEETRRRLAARVAEKVAAFEGEVRAAHAECTVVDAAGRKQEINAAAKTFDEFLARHAALILQRIYPAFERFAPGHGPLPKEAQRRFADFALAQEMSAESADEYVNLIREAYLVPMKLLVRRGRGYAAPPNVEKNELVRLVMPLLEHKPAPETVFAHLAQPIYGLVPDQAHLLLLFLLAAGELDVVKQGKSYRELYALLPDMRQYDRVVAVKGLGAEALRGLADLCSGLSLRVPPQWTVAAQRRSVERLRVTGRELAACVEPLVLALQSRGGGEKLVERLARLLEQWRALEAGADLLAAFEQFLYGVQPVERFVRETIGARELPGRIERLIAEVERHRHVFALLPRPEAGAAQPALPCDDPGEPPGMDQIAALEEWLKQAQAAYERYRGEYRKRHDAYWRALDESPAWRYQPPPAARSRHAGLETELRALAEARAKAAGLRCRGLVDLHFQPFCRCGFDGAAAPVDAELQRIQEAQAGIEIGLRRFFGQERVREQVRALKDEGLLTGPAALAYLRGEAPCPEVTDVERLDRQLAGVELVKPLRADLLFARLAGRSFDRQELCAAIEALFDGVAGESGRVRFDLETTDGGEVAAWCLAQALRHGVPLPRGLRAEDLAAAAELIRPDRVGEAALRRLDRLGLGEAALARVTRYLIEGQVPAPAPAAEDAPLLAAARELVAPHAPADAAALAQLAAVLYGAHARMWRIAGERWLARLDQLAETRLDVVPDDLAVVLEGLRERQWLIIDCLGLPLTPLLLDDLREILGQWRLEQTVYALVSTESSTDACWRKLIDAGLVRSCEKVDAIDRLIHGRSEALDDMARLAAAELRIACRGALRRLDATRPLAVFADHGFRLQRDGRAFGHGGASTLERVVPVLLLAPA
ncbi:MAG: hypothetical protein HY812_18400 [Planctomycetes bacterium]|nr:hypothetical protein [Planctomycetota bacterium]